MACTCGGAARRAGRIGLALVLWAASAAGQVGEAPPPATAVESAAAIAPAEAAPAPEGALAPATDPAPAPTVSLLEKAWLDPAASFEEADGSTN